LVLRAGLEPARITPHAPQTCAATNYATSAILNFQAIAKNYFFVFVGFAVLVALFAVLTVLAVFAAVFEVLPVAFEAELAGTDEFKFVIGGT
jgi:hypothetical protein